MKVCFIGCRHGCHARTMSLEPDPGCCSCDSRFDPRGFSLSPTRGCRLVHPVVHPREPNTGVSICLLALDPSEGSTVHPVRQMEPRSGFAESRTCDAHLPTSPVLSWVHLWRFVAHPCAESTGRSFARATECVSIQCQPSHCLQLNGVAPPHM